MVTMETLCFHKSDNFKDTHQKISVPRAMSTNLRKNTFKLFKTPPQNNSWADLGAKIGLSKTQLNVCSKRRDSDSWTDIDRQKQRLRHEI